MAAPSPVLGNTGAAASPAAHAPPKSQRGLNKPKCIQCGNVARSRCPYQSCKSCCSKAQNPCHIHVLKANASIPEKIHSSGSPAVEQQPMKLNDASSSASSLRVATLRQLSSNFAQLNNVHVPLRSRKPLTRKEAAAINEWRFSKLREFMDRNIEVENEAFDRYMQNISLLEGVFSTKSISEGPREDESLSKQKPASAEDNNGMVTARLKLELRSNAARTDNYRRRIQKIVDERLNELRKSELIDSTADQNEPNEMDQMAKRAKCWQSRCLDIASLVDKLNKARNEEDLRSCEELKSQLFGQRTKPNEIEKEDREKCEQNVKEELVPIKEIDYSLPKLVRTSEIDQKTLDSIDAHFCSLEQIEDL